MLRRILFTCIFTLLAAACGDDSTGSTTTDGGFTFDSSTMPDATVMSDATVMPDAVVNTDRDGDGVPNGSDPFPDDKNACGDSDGDSCDDCVSGTKATSNDGTDTNSDGLCDACDTATCGGKGECALEGVAVVCLCDETFAGENCEVCAEGLQDRDNNGTCTPVCDETTCSGNGACDDASGTATCSCEPGWGGADCATVDCTGVTCAGTTGTGTCNADGDVAVCECADGFQDNDGDFTCETACVGDGSSCSNNGTCDDSSGAIACECDPGAAGADCSVTDCTDQTCGGFGTCDDSGTSPVCNCDEGYQDDDGDLVCSPGCSVSTCSFNGTCDIVGGEATCTCELGWSGDDCATVDCTGVNCGMGMCDDAGAEAVCVCDRYYEADGLSCVDVDECETDNGRCGDPAYVSCTNNVGTVPTCSDINECLTDNGGCGDPAVANCINVVAAGNLCECIPSDVYGPGCNRPCIDGICPLGHWPLEEGSGTVFQDYSGNDLPGVTAGGASWTADGRVAGEQVMSFDGSGSGAVTFPGNLRDGPDDAVKIPQGDVTFSMWFNTTATTVEGLQVVNSTTGGCDRVVGDSSAGLRSNIWSEQNSAATWAVNDGRWHHMVYVLDRAEGAILYIDGARYSAITTPTGNCGVGCSGFDWADIYRFGNAGNCRFGAQGFVGMIDEVAMWDGPLSSEQVVTLYEQQGGMIYKDCSAIKAADQTATSGNYVIDLDGAGGEAPIAAYCDMETLGGGWTQLLNQTVGNYHSKAAWRAGINTSRPNSGNYSILNLLDSGEFQTASGGYEFALLWPGLDSDANDVDDYMHWEQDTNPFTGRGTITNVDENPVNQDGGGNLPAQDFAGLGDDSGTATLDGTVGSNWFHAVGTTGVWSGGIPAYNNPNTPGGTAETGFYVRTSLPTSCADVFAADADAPDGDYVIDADGPAGAAPTTMSCQK